MYQRVAISGQPAISPSGGKEKLFWSITNGARLLPRIKLLRNNRLKSPESTQSTWRRAWQCYDDTMKLDPEYIAGNFFKSLSSLPGFSDYWRNEFDKV
jgi:hypothetical protein